MIPFLGAGASLCERPAQCDWRQGYLPSGSELAAFFAENYAYPEHEPLDLVRVSQYVELTAGDATLYEELHSIFAGMYEPNKLHTCSPSSRRSSVLEPGRRPDSS